jgi:hypothetical protein
METHGLPAITRKTAVRKDGDPRSATGRVLGARMKLHLNDAKVGQILDLYCMYLEQEEGLQAPMSDIIEGIVLYFLDEHPQFRAWHVRRRYSGGGVNERSRKQMRNGSERKGYHGEGETHLMTSSCR